MKGFVIRPAAAGEAAGIARIHVETRRTTYVGIVPSEFLAQLDYIGKTRGITDRVLGLKRADRCAFFDDFETR